MKGPKKVFIVQRWEVFTNGGFTVVQKSKETSGLRLMLKMKRETVGNI